MHRTLYPLALALFSWLLAACKEAPIGTEVIVVVDSELKAGEELSRLRILVLDKSGEGSPLREVEFALSPNPAEGRYRLPLSFSVVPSAQEDNREFRVVVTGLGTSGQDGSERPIVEQQAIARFQPNSVRRLDVMLTRACVDRLCWDGDRRADQTCDGAGECVVVPRYDRLPKAGAGVLAGYPGSGGQTEESDGGEPVVARDEDSGQPNSRTDDPELDASITSDATIATASGEGGSGATALCQPNPCADMKNRSCDPRSGRCVCEHRCEAPELTRCESSMLSVCKADVDGCRDWVPARTCDLGCGDALSCAGCTNECAQAGRGECGTNQVRLCIANADGCLVLGEVSSCADTNPCTTDRCNAQLGRCENVPNDQLCTAHAGNACMRDYCDATLGCAVQNTTQSCNDGVACTTGDVCRNGVCAGTLDANMASCVDLCPADSLKTAPLACGCGVAEQTGDRDRDGTIDCLDRCPDDQCSAVGVSCSNDTVRTCTANASGCRMLAQRTCAGACFDGTRCTKTALRYWGANEEVTPHAVAVDAQGNAYVVGMATSAVGTAPPLGSQDVVISKWSSAGTRLWDVLWGSTLPEYAHDVAVNAAGDRIAVVGSVNSQLFVGVWGTQAAGAPLWTVTIPSPNPYAQVHGVVYGPGGDVYVAGRTTLGALPGQSSAGLHDAFAMRLSATTGMTIWSSQWGTAANDNAYDIATDGTSLYVAGVRSFTDLNDTVSGDAFLRKLSSGGALLWERLIDAGQRDWGKSVAVDASGNAVLAGTSYGADGQGLLTRITTTNTVQWSQAVTITDDVELDAAGNVYSVSFNTLSKHNAGGLLWDLSLGVAGSYVADLAVHEPTGMPLRVLAVGQETPGQTNPKAFFAILTAE